jgi:hypothetical protein
VDSSDTESPAIASKLAPTRIFGVNAIYAIQQNPVGASLLAMAPEQTLQISGMS